MGERACGSADVVGDGVALTGGRAAMSGVLIPGTDFPDAVSVLCDWIQSYKHYFGIVYDVIVR
jgi:hypothetical protein